MFLQLMAGGTGFFRQCLNCTLLLQANRGGQASISAPTPVQAEAHSNGSWQSANGSASATSAEVDEADPAWLQLPVIHYALMQGNQQPSFRLATGQHDTRHWLAWEVGFVSCHYGFRVQGL